MSIKELRHRRGLTQVQLAQLTGMKQQSLSAYERGIMEVRNMSADNAQKLCKALNCTLSELLEG
jgi:transcriptional regulator with XRE-family HTH domain